ncbi:MAG: hypothetical protein AAF799_25230 [Myxococcota bacterium]
MELVHTTIRGAHLLHWLTFAMPAATLLVVSGVLRSRRAAKLILLGIVVTFATLLLSSYAPELHQVRYGAPLPIVRTGYDTMGDGGRTSLTILRAGFVADLLFWCSSTVLAGASIQTLARRLSPRRTPSRV